MSAMMGADASGGIDDGRLTGHQVLIAGLCALVAALDGFDTQAIAYVAPSIGEAWGIDKALFGPVFSAGLLGLTIGALLLSPLGDRWGRKGVIVACTATFGLLALLTSRAETIQELLVYRLLTGIGLGGAMPNLIALTSEYAPRRLQATLVTVMFCGFPLGSTIGGLVSAPLIVSHGWQAVFVLGGVVPLALVPVLLIFLPESARFLALRGGGPRLTALLAKTAPHLSGEAFVAQVRAEAPGSGQDRLSIAALFTHGRAPMTALIWLAFFMNLLVMYFLVNWMPSLLRDQGLSLNVAVASTAILNLGGVVGAIILGRFLDRTDPFVVLGLAYAAAAVFIAVIAFAGSEIPLSTLR